MIQLTGLWTNKTKNNESYLSGNLGGARVLIFKNNKKKPGSNEPDYNLVIAENSKQKESKPSIPLPEVTPNVTLEDIPF